LRTPILKIPKPILIEQDILDFKEQQQKDGRAEETITARIQTLRQVSKIVDINDPELIKTWLGDTKNEHHFTKPCTWSNRTKTKLIDTYTAYLKYRQITWNPPRYAFPERLPFIPMEQEIDLLIAHCGRKTATILQMLKETGMRIGELTQLMPTDIDTQRKTVTITPEKGSNPRILPISDKLITMIQNLPKDPRTKYKTLFNPRKDNLRTMFTVQRKILAEKLSNPRLRKITFHTLRHWKGTIEYHKTQDIMHVKTILGHKRITSTEIYINLEQALFLQSNDNFTCKVAHDEKEETELIEAGFEHINNRQNLAFYRKRK
jgi:integrase